MGSQRVRHDSAHTRLDRMAGLAVCLRPRQRGIRSPKWWFGCQRILHNLWCWTRVTYISPRFHNHHAFLWVWSWWGRVYAGGKLAEPSTLPNRWVSSGNQQGVSLCFHSHLPFTRVPVTHCQSFGGGISASFDPFTRQHVQTCGSRLLLSQAPTFRSQLPWCCFWNPSQTTYRLPLAQVVFQGPHKPGISLSKITLRPCECAGDIFSGLPDCISLFISDFHLDSHTFSILFWSFKKADCTPNSRNGSDLLK